MYVWFMTFKLEKNQINHGVFLRIATSKALGLRPLLTLDIFV